MARKKSPSNDENKQPSESKRPTAYKFKPIKWSPQKRQSSRIKAIKNEIQCEKKLKKVVQSNLTRSVQTDDQTPKSSLQDHQLRYIIIDGSNVAIE